MTGQCGKIPPDEVFDRLDWRDAALTDMVGCAVVGAEPIIGWYKRQEPIAEGYVLYAIWPDGAERAVSVENAECSEDGLILRIADIPKRLGF